MIDRWFHKLDLILARAAELVRQYPQRLAAIVALLALSGAGATFAVANLASNDFPMSTREVVESVQSPSIGTQIEALAEQTEYLYRSTQSRSGDSPETLLKRLGLSDPEALQALRNDPLFQKEVLGRLGRSVVAQAQGGKHLTEITARWMNSDNTFGRWTLRKTASAFASNFQSLPLVASQRLGSGTINSTLFSATDEAQIPDSVAVQLAEIFSGDLDFHRLHKGDRFSVVYETLQGDGEVLGVGRVRSAEFLTNGKTFQAVWFNNPHNPADKGAYYTPQGDSMARAFLSSPVEFSRVTSGFAMRFHPILQTWRAHLGVDYGAAVGTPARTVADGVVSFAGVQNGYGNVVFVQHNASQTTVYAHLSKLLVHTGEKISQGQTIGLVGATGWATGPHLHFEFRVNGIHQDPQKFAQSAPSAPVSGAQRAAFMEQAAAAKTQLAAAALINQASAQ
jgi:murein DD-endopeptidase MepM/ murein hydrolase activator NlpD